MANQVKIVVALAICALQAFSINAEYNIEYILSSTGCGDGKDITTFEECGEAAMYLMEAEGSGMESGYTITDVTPKTNNGKTRFKKPKFCYYDFTKNTLQFNPVGRARASLSRQSLCLLESPSTAAPSPVPTPAPSSISAMPTPAPSSISAMPTPAPSSISAVPTPAPSPSPTPAPFPMPEMDFMLSPSGCKAGFSITSKADCEAAAMYLMELEGSGMMESEYMISDTTATTNDGKKRFQRPKFCYYDVKKDSLQFNPSGRSKNTPSLPALCAVDPTETLKPTTASPTPAPTTGMPTTLKPTFAPVDDQFSAVFSTSGCPAGTEITSMALCERAAYFLYLQDQAGSGDYGVDDLSATMNDGKSRFMRPKFCYYDFDKDSLQFNPVGRGRSTESRPNICFSSPSE